MTDLHHSDASHTLYSALCAGRALSRDDLASAMQRSTGDTDASSQWSWADAYDVAQLASSKFIVEQASRLPFDDPSRILSVLQRLETMLPVQTHRNDETVNLQQFNTPASLAYAMCCALGDLTCLRVLEPSAGTGMIAALASAMGAIVHCNELSPRRASLLSSLFDTSTHDATSLHHRMGSTKFDAVLMNPPFGRVRGERTKARDAMYKHIASASRLLAPGGRLVAITSEHFHDRHPTYRAQVRSLARLGLSQRVSIPLGPLFKAVGTSWPVRLTVWDKQPGDLIAEAPISSYLDLSTHLRSLEPVSPQPEAPVSAFSFSSYRPAKKRTVNASATISLKPENIEYRAAEPQELVQVGAYAAWKPTVVVEGSKPHPATLVQSIALASTTPQMPTAPLSLPRHLVTEGILSDSQLEALIRANDAHSQYIPGTYSVHDTDAKTVLHYDVDNGKRYRLGSFLGDGTGASKSRPICGLFLLNYFAGRKKGLWVSMNSDLSTDARKEWSAVGGAPSQIVDISRFKITDRIDMREGILFVPYGTLRSTNPQNNASRFEQVLEWLGSDFDGVLAFDEAHAMAHALPTKTSQGRTSPGSLQGRVGLQLQNALPDARVVYSSATSSIHPRQLSYANRLGIWGHNCPFETRHEYLSSMEDAGLTGMEVISRDLATAGRYISRNLSFEGIECSRLEHTLTDEQIKVWNLYADAFVHIHQNIVDALDACDALSSGSAKSAAYSAFESTKQRFFNQLLGAMETPTLIADIEQALADGKAVVLQLTSTGEAYLNRALDEVSPDEHNDLQVDLSPRRMIVQMLESAFPTVAHHEVSDGDDGFVTVPLVDEDGRPVHNPDAIAAREQLIDDILTLPPMPTLLDRVIWHFGADAVAEVTGRTKRVIFEDGVYKLQKRSAASRMNDIADFENDKRRILAFSAAGSAGRGFHADRRFKNQRLRRHILAEAGWVAFTAVQGFGRTPRTNQVQQPEFVLLTSNVPGKARFISTIARRLASLGAMTKGQRDAGSNGLMSAADSLEGDVASFALHNLLVAVRGEKIDGMSCADFEAATGLCLDVDLDETPVTVNRFLNRVLAMRFADQHLIFGEYIKRYNAITEQLSDAGKLERSIETLDVDDIQLLREVDVCESVFGGTIAREYEHEQPCFYPSFAEIAREKGAWYVTSDHSAVAKVRPCLPLFNRADGTEIPRVALILHDGTINRMPVDAFDNSNWVRPSRQDTAREIWMQLQDQLPTRRMEKFWLITGALLPVWTDLFRITGQSVRIVRLSHSSKRSEIGAFLYPTQASMFLSGRGVSAKDAIDSDTVVDAILRDNRSFELANGWRLKRSSIEGTARIEVVGPDIHSRSWVENLGVFNERIRWQMRWFVPVDKAADVLTALLHKYPVK